MRTILSKIGHFYNYLKFRSSPKYFVSVINLKYFQISCCSSHAVCAKQSNNIREINAKNISHISKTEDVERSNIIVNEVQMAIEKNRRIPEFISDNEIQELYRLETRSQRMSYLSYLFKKEKLRLSDAIKKEIKQKENSLKKPLDYTETCSEYGLGRNTLLISLRNHSKHKFWNKRLANAALFGEKIVLDLSFDELMTEKEIKSCAAQLQHLYSVNRRSNDPYDVYFCNANSSFRCVQKLKLYIPNIYDSLLTLTEKSYTDIFPLDKLVYLSPHAAETLHQYDHTAVYIIGAFVDIVKKKHISLHKAESIGIKSYKLPLDDYIMWGAGSKSLAINHVFEIMLALKNTRSWHKAFEVIPSRKIRKLDIEKIGGKSSSDKIYLVS